MTGAPLIVIVDDDEGVRSSTASLMRSVGYATQTYGSAEDFLCDQLNDEPACMITDMQMPAMSGADLQQKLISDGRVFPIIFMTAFPNETLRERVMAAGAVGFLSKPSDGEAIIQSVMSALGLSAPKLVH